MPTGAGESRADRKNRSLAATGSGSLRWKDYAAESRTIIAGSAAGVSGGIPLALAAADRGGCLCAGGRGGGRFVSSRFRDGSGGVFSGVGAFLGACCGCGGGGAGRSAGMAAFRGMRWCSRGGTVDRARPARRGGKIAGRGGTRRSRWRWHVAMLAESGDGIRFCGNGGRGFPPVVTPAESCGEVRLRVDGCDHCSGGGLFPS